MYISTKTSRIRQREAQRARDNRAEIVKARSIGQISRRDLIRWGIFTTGGMLVCKNGLSPFARSAFAAVPTVFGDQFAGQPNAKRMSYHNDFSNLGGPVADNPYRNPVTNRGPMEGRPPGEAFAHQRWNECLPKVGYVMSWTQCAPGTKFHPNFPDQNPNAVWAYGTGNVGQSSMPPALIKGRYGEPILTRISARKMGVSDATSSSCISITPTTEPKATVPRARIIFRGRSTTISGARRRRVETRSTPMPRIVGLPDRTAMVVSSMCPVTSANSRARSGPTTTASSSRPRMSTKATSAL